MLAGFRSFGFSGSRSLSGRPWARCRSLAARAAAAGCLVLTGCAPGADAAARAGAPAARVFRVDRWREAGLPWPAAFARRSAAFVQSLAGCPAPVLVAFPGGPCPAALRPAASARAAFAGFGSGTWASAALAAGLDVPVVVFLPSGARPPGWGPWSPVASGPLRGAWRLPPLGAVQAELFDELFSE